MKHLRYAILLILIMSVAVVLNAQKVTTKSTKYYQISYPADWESTDTDDGFTAFTSTNSMIPLTLLISVEKIDADDIEADLATLGEKFMAGGAAELEDFGIDVEMDTELAEETRLNGFPTFHYVMNLGFMGMNTQTDSYLFLKGDKMISLNVVGDTEDMQEHEDEIQAIFKSFSLK